MRDHPLTLRERVLMYFARNPDEELTSRDIVEKFDCLRTKVVGSRLRDAVASGLLCRSWQVGQQAVYTAGPMLLIEVGANIKEHP